MDDIRRAERAERLLEHDLMVEARAHIRDQLTKAMWNRSGLVEADQVKLDAYVRHFESFFSFFDRVIADGKVAEADLKMKGRVRKTLDQIKTSF